MSCFSWCCACCEDTVSKYNSNDIVSSINHSIDRRQANRDDDREQDIVPLSWTNLSIDDNNVLNFPERIRKIIAGYLATEGPSSDKDLHANMAWNYFLAQYHSSIRTTRSNFFMTEYLMELINEICSQTTRLEIPCPFTKQEFSDDFTNVLEKHFAGHLLELKINFSEYMEFSHLHFPQFPYLKKLVIEDASYLNMYDIGILLNLMPVDKQTADDEVYELRFPMIKSLYLTEASKLMDSKKNTFSAEFVRFARSIFQRNGQLHKIQNDGHVILRCKTTEPQQLPIKRSKHRRIVTLTVTTAEALEKSLAEKRRNSDSPALDAISPARDSCSLLELTSNLRNLNLTTKRSSVSSSINTAPTQTQPSTSTSASCSSLSSQSSSPQ